MHRATTTDEALALFDPKHALSGTDERWVDLWPSRQDRPLTRMVGRKLHSGQEQPVQGLILGHRGSGKSTELHRVADALSGAFLVRVIDVELVLDMDDIALSDIVLVLLEALLAEAKDASLRLPVGDLELLRGWSAIETTTRLAERGLSAELKAGVDTEGLLSATLGLLAGFVSRINLGTTHRREVRQIFEPRLSDLLGVAERLSRAVMAAARDNGWEGVLLLVDGLDRMRFDAGSEGGPTSYEQLLVLNAPQLQRVRTHLLVVAPIGLSVQGRPDNAWDIFHVPNAQVRSRAGAPVEAHIDAMVELVARRAVLDQLFERGLEAARQVGRLSGGNPRDALRIVEGAARRVEGRRLTDDDIEHAARSYGSDLWARTRSDEERAFLDQLGTGTVDVTATPLVQRLLGQGILLNYRNSEHWAAVHPCIAGLRRYAEPAA